MSHEPRSTDGEALRSVVLKPGGTDGHRWADLWERRELFLILAWRDVAVQYKQTVVGVLWAVLRPFLTMMILAFVFGRIAGLSSGGAAPYPLFVLAGILPWFLMSTIVGDASRSLVDNAALVQKVYFPRLIIPAASSGVALVDFAMNLVFLGGVMAWYGFLPGWQVVLLPFVVALAVAAGLGPGFLLGALGVRYRDVRHVIPFVIQIGLYLSPVGFPSAVVPDGWRLVYALNPAVGVIESFRWCILGGSSEIYLPGLGVSIAVILVMLRVGTTYFLRAERTFADVI